MRRWRVSSFGPVRTFAALGWRTAIGGCSAAGSALRCVGGDFGPAADLLSLLVQRKKAKKHLNECGAPFQPWSSLAALWPSACGFSRSGARQTGPARPWPPQHRTAVERAEGEGRSRAMHRSRRQRQCGSFAVASYGKQPWPRETTLQHRAARLAKSRPVERLLRETPHADGRSAAIDDNGSNGVPYSKVLSLPSFFAPAKKEGRPRGRNPRLRTAARRQRLSTRQGSSSNRRQRTTGSGRKPSLAVPACRP
jgi:hypothetical protein